MAGDGRVLYVLPVNRVAGERGGHHVMPSASLCGLRGRWRIRGRSWSAENGPGPILRVDRLRGSVRLAPWHAAVVGERDARQREQALEEVRRGARARRSTASEVYRRRGPLQRTHASRVLLASGSVRCVIISITLSHK